MVDAVRGAGLVEGVLAGDLFVFFGKAIGELAAVVGEHRLDFDGCDSLQATQKVGAALLALVRIETEPDPARGPIDGYEQVTPRAFVRHLRQVFDVDMHKARG